MAAAFINFFVNDIEANRVLGGERGVPIIGQVRNTLAEEADDTVRIVFEYIDLIGRIASRPQPPEPAGMMEFSDLIERTQEQISFGVITPEQAAANVVREGAEILAR